MNFQLKHRQVTCPPELAEVIENKVTRFEKLVPETTYIEVVLVQHAKAHGNGDKEAEVIVDIPGVKPVIRFSAIGETFLEAVDIIFDHLDQELSKLKHKHDDHHAGAGLKERVAEVMHQAE